MRYDKLVRDKIPEIIETKGEIPKIHYATDEEYYKLLKNKLQEEVNEFLESNNPQELTDILEVIYALSCHHKIPIKNLEAMRQIKKEDRGGFEKRIILEEVID